MSGVAGEGWSARRVEKSTLTPVFPPTTAPLRDPAFFARHYIELGALAWPKGLDFRAESLCRRLEHARKLVRNRAV